MKTILIFLTTLFISFSIYAEKLTIYTYDSFVSEWGPGPIIEKIFEEKHNADVEIPFIKGDRTSAWAQYTIKCADRAVLQHKLSKNNIPVAVHYPLPLNKQPAVADMEVKTEVGDLLSNQVLSIPMHAYMSEATADKIIEAIVNDF